MAAWARSSGFFVPSSLLFLVINVPAVRTETFVVSQVLDLADVDLSEHFSGGITL